MKHNFFRSHLLAYSDVPSIILVLDIFAFPCSLNVAHLFSTELLITTNSAQNRASDSRMFKSYSSRPMWANVQHPIFPTLVPMLKELATSLQSDRRLWERELQEEFLHEVLMRVLLHESVRVKTEDGDFGVTLEERHRTVPRVLRFVVPSFENDNGKLIDLAQG